jgi:hypothetical protein
MAICESLILVCTLVGKNEHWIDIGIKREYYEAFCAFSAKRWKVNPMTKSQLVVNPDFRASKSQHEVPKVSRKRIPEVWSKVNFGQPWSTPRVKVKVRVKVNLVTHQEASKASKTILDIMRSPIDYSSLLFFPCEIPPLPFIKLSSH